MTHLDLWLLSLRHVLKLSRAFLAVWAALLNHRFCLDRAAVRAERLLILCTVCVSTVVNSLALAFLRVRQPSRNFDDVADSRALQGPAQRPLNRGAAPIQRGLTSLPRSF